MRIALALLLLLPVVLSAPTHPRPEECAAMLLSPNKEWRKFGRRALDEGSSAEYREKVLRVLAQWARVRGWQNVRLVSSHGSSLKDDLRMQDGEGRQQPGVSVFTREPDGRIRHFYTGEAMMAPEHFRGMDLLSPVWNLLDLLPEGRGDWMPRLDYDG